MKKKNKKIKPLKKSSIKTLQSKARHGDVSAIKYLKAHGIKIKLDAKIGAPKKGEQYTEKTQKEYLNRIARNIKLENETFRNRNEYNKKVFGFDSSSTSIPGIKKMAQGPKGKATIGTIESLKEYAATTKAFISGRAEDIKEAWKKGTTKGHELIDKLTDKQVIDFYNSKYFVYSEKNELDSDALKAYENDNGETLQVSRLVDWAAENGIDLLDYQGRFDSTSVKDEFIGKQEGK